MDTNKNNLENVFKEAFQNFEKPAGAKVWTGVKAAIGTGATAATAAAAAKSTLGIGAKVAIVAAVIGIASISTYLYVNHDNELNKTKEIVDATAPINTIENQEISESPKEITTTTENTIVESSNEIQEENKLSNSEAQKAAISSEKVIKKSEKNSTKKSNITDVKVEKSVNQNTNFSANKAETSKNEASENTNTVNNNEKAISTSTSNNEKEKKNTKAATLLAKILLNQTEGQSPFYLQFNSNEAASSYEWRLNDKIISTNQSDQYRIDEVGNYELKLVVTDENNHTATGTEIISVSPTFANIFTPNGDGANDIFRIDGDFDKLEVHIFDKSAKEIHNWTGNYGFWDGYRADGSTAAEGTYFYTVKYSLNGIEKIKKGTITLKR